MSEGVSTPLIDICVRPGAVAKVHPEPDGTFSLIWRRGGGGGSLGVVQIILTRLELQDLASSAILAQSLAATPAAVE